MPLMKSKPKAKARTKPARKTLMSGEAARRIGTPLWCIYACIHRGLLKRPPRHGRYFLHRVEDLPAIRQALIQGGYVKERDPAGD